MIKKTNVTYQLISMINVWNKRKKKKRNTKLQLKKKMIAKIMIVSVMARDIVSITNVLNLI